MSKAYEVDDADAGMIAMFLGDSPIEPYEPNAAEENDIPSWEELMNTWEGLELLIDRCQMRGYEVTVNFNGSCRLFNAGVIWKEEYPRDVKRAIYATIVGALYNDGFLFDGITERSEKKNHTMIDESKYPKNVLRLLKPLAKDEEELEDLLYQWDERCGIRHYEGGEPMETAEYEALVEMLQRLGCMIDPLIEGP